VLVYFSFRQKLISEKVSFECWFIYVQTSMSVFRNSELPVFQKINAEKI